jgi:hypothetical protein
MKISYGVPAPPKKRAGRPRVYHFEEMEVGSCATIESSYNSIYSCIKRFTAHTQYENWVFRLQKHGEDKVRVWRIE